MCLANVSATFFTGRRVIKEDEVAIWGKVVTEDDLSMICLPRNFEDTQNELNGIIRLDCAFTDPFYLHVSKATL